MSTGFRFGEERARLGKTQDEIADFAGVTRRTIGRIENDDSAPDGDLLGKLSKLGFDAQYILTGVRSVNLDRVAEEAGTYKVETGVGALSKDEEVLVKKYRQLDPKTRTHAQAVVDALAATTTVKGKKAKG